MAKKTQTLEGHVSGQANQPLSRPAHALPYSSVIQEIGCDPENGLTSSEATSRYGKYGNNDLGEDGGVQPGKILLRQVANAMTLVRQAPQYLSHATYADTIPLDSHPSHGCEFWNQVMDRRRCSNRHHPAEHHRGLHPGVQC